MAKEVVVPNQGIRERHLNIIYFIDSSKSHSIRVNLIVARWILAGSVGLILWSILSLGWIISLGHVLDVTRTHLGTALTSIFDYQVKYDHVFDQAYPDSTTQGYYASGSHLPINNPVDGLAQNVEPSTKAAVASKETAAAVKRDAAAAVPTAAGLEIANPPAPAALPAADTKPTSLADAAKPDRASLSMEIRNSSITAQNGKMTLLFDISNKDVQKKAEGYIWATGTVQLADGTTRRVVAPAHSRLNTDGSIDAYTSTYKFSIQKFKRKDFTFAVPNDETWKVTDLKITYVNSMGKLPQTVPVTTPVTFTKGAPVSSDTESTSDDASNQ